MMSQRQIQIWYLWGNHTQWSFDLFTYYFTYYTSRCNERTQSQVQGYFIPVVFLLSCPRLYTCILLTKSDTDVIAELITFICLRRKSSQVTSLLALCLRVCEACAWRLRPFPATLGTQSRYQTRKHRSEFLGSAPFAFQVRRRSSTRQIDYPQAVGATALRREPEEGMWHVLPDGQRPCVKRTSSI